jgi:lactoylglutathione lyase
MTDWPGPISAITVFTEDLAATKSFYERVFGLPPFYADEDSTVYMFGATMINLLKISGAGELIAPLRAGAPDDIRMQFTLDVDDVDAKVAELAELGVPILNGPIDRPWGIRTATFRDPAGTVWEISAPLQTV